VTRGACKPVAGRSLAWLTLVFATLIGHESAPADSALFALVWQSVVLCLPASRQCSGTPLWPFPICDLQ